MSYSAYVTKLENVRRAENSDRLYLAEVFHEGVIIDDSMHEGEEVLYLPQDGEIARWFGDEFSLFIKNTDGTIQGGYIANNGHIKAIRLRGHESCGVVLPLTKIYRIFGDQHWELGSEVTTINGQEFCKKYIPKKKSAAAGNVVLKTSLRGRKSRKGTYPEFEMHIDTKQLAYYLDDFKPGDRINMTLKLHGTSQRSMNTYIEYPQSFFRKLLHIKPRRKQAYVLGTRRTVVQGNEGFYGDNGFRLQHHNALKPYLAKGMEIFCEIVGYYGPDAAATIMPIVDNTKINDKEFIEQFGEQTVFSYGCQPGESAMYIYRITSENGAHEWTPEEITQWCAENGFNRVPIVDDFEFTTQEDLLRRIDDYFSDKVDPIGKTHIKEGVVIRIVNRPTFTAYKSKMLEFKILEGLAKDNAEAPDMEEIQEEIIC